MASFLRNMRSGFTRQNEGPNLNASQRTGSPNQSPTAVSPSVPPANQQSPLQSNMSSHSENSHGDDGQLAYQPAKFFFREKYAKLGVKGSFMPLAAQPAHVECADWLAHQTVEQYRIITSILLIIQEANKTTGKATCNPESCPQMSAGTHTYTWLDNHKQPIAVNAPQYISLVQRWMNSKIYDEKAFPTEPSPVVSASTYASGSVTTPTGESAIPAGPTTLRDALPALAGRDWIGKGAGFPESFLHDCRTCWRQMFRIYAHLYHSHWVEPFWHLSTDTKNFGYTDLNSCFVLFCTIAKLFRLLSDKDMETMQPLIEIWITSGIIPEDAARGACALVAQ